MNFMNTPIFLTIVTLNILLYLAAITMSLMVYKKYRYLGHLWLLISFFLFFIAYLFRVSVNMVSEDLISNLWTISNLLLMPGILGLIFVSLLSQYDRLPLRAHFITALVGIIMGLLASSSNVKIIVDDTGINAIYAPAVGGFSAVLLLLFIVFILRPLVIKIRSKRLSFKQLHIMLLVIAYLLMVSWVAMTSFTSNTIIRQIRPLIFSAGTFFWSLSLVTNPLSLAITTSRTQMVIVSNKVGIPLVSLDVISGEEADTTLLVGLLNAVKSSMEGVVGDVALKSIIFRDSVLFFIQGTYAILIFVLSGNVSSNLELVGRYYLQEFEEKYEKHLRDQKGAVYPDKYKQEIPEIKKILQDVHIS